MAGRPRLTIEAAANVLLTAAAAVLAGPAPDQAWHPKQAHGGSGNGAGFDWAATGGNGAASAANPYPSHGAGVNGLLKGAAANGNGASDAGLVLPVQVRLFWRYRHCTFLSGSVGSQGA